MESAQEKEIDVLETFIDFQVVLPESSIILSNSTYCEEIWRELMHNNFSLHQTNVDEQDGNLTSFFDKCLNETLLDEIGTQPYILPWYVQLVWISVFAVMILTAIIGNLIVIWIIVAHRRMRTVTNLFLLNLSITDFLLASGNAAFNFVFMLNSHWPFGSVLCVISNVVANLSVSTSVFTMLAMSLERFLAVILPLRHRMTKVMTVTIILLVWALSSLLCIPSFLYATTVTYKYSDVQQRTLCYLKWPDGENGVSYLDYIYNIVFLVVTYVLPILCMTFTYSWIGFILWSSKVIGENTGLQNQAVRSKHRVVHMLVAVMLLFAICWLPYHVYFLYTYYNNEILRTNYIQHVYLAIYWLAMSNSCYNPIVYYKMNARFRSYFQEALCIHSKPADVGTFNDKNKSYQLDARSSILTTNRTMSYRISFPKRKIRNQSTASI